MSDIPSNPKRVAPAIAPRSSGGDSSKSAEEVINDAPLQTSGTVTEPPAQAEVSKKPWLEGITASEAELSSMNVKKSLDMPALIQAKLTFIVELEKKKVRGFGQKKVNERQIMLEEIDAGLNKRLKKLGYNPD